MTDAIKEQLAKIREQKFQKAPFIRTKLDGEERLDCFTVRVNREEREMLELGKKILKQPKDSSAIKQLAMIGSLVIHDGLTAQVLQLVLENKRRASRLGINEF